MIYVYAVRMAPNGSKHEHIEAVKWKDPDTGSKGEYSREQMIDWIDRGGAAYVCGDHAHIARVGIVRASRPYIRTQADGDWNDNLLALPTYSE